MTEDMWKLLQFSVFPPLLFQVYPMFSPVHCHYQGSNVLWCCTTFFSCHFEVKVYWLILNLHPDTKYYSLSGMWNHVFMRIFSVMFLSSVFLLQDVRPWCRYFFPELWGPVLSCTPRRREKDGWYQDDLLEIGDLNEMFSSSFVI